MSYQLTARLVRAVAACVIVWALLALTAGQGWWRWPVTLLAAMAAAQVADSAYRKIHEGRVRVQWRGDKPMATEEVMLNWYESAWHPIYCRGVEEGPASLQTKDRVLFLVGYVIDQLVAGGAEMIYANPSGAYAPQMADALESVGATQAARVMREINALFPGGTPDPDDDVRERQIEELPSMAAEKGRELEMIFDSWLPDGGGRVLLAQLYEFYHSPRASGAA